MIENINEYIDHTCLSPSSTDEDIKRLCKEAIKYKFCSVCINPSDISLAKEILAKSGVRVCTVIGFPLGKSKTETKVCETELALHDGCDEFDMVINVGWLKDGYDACVLNDIKAVVNAACGHTVKVILETGLLSDSEIIRAVKLSCEAGASFVKTCTGFSQGKATLHAVELMAKNVSCGVKVKASAGIRTYEEAEAFILAGASRIGTSAGIQIMRAIMPE